MRKVKEVDINGRNLTLNELTVEEVFNLFDGLGGSLLGMMFDGRLPMAVVAKSSGVTETELEKWHPADIDTLITEVETVNPHCARFGKILAKTKAEAEAGRDLKTSGKPVGT